MLIRRFGKKRILSWMMLVVFITGPGCEKKEKDLKIGRYNDDRVKFMKRYREDVLHGESVWFYPNGNIEEKVIFKNGKANGHAYYFHRSGALKSHRFWIQDKMVGFCADYFDDTISLVQHALYFNTNGDLVYRKTFDKTGKVIKEEGSNKLPGKTNNY